MKATTQLPKTQSGNARKGLPLQGRGQSNGRKSAISSMLVPIDFSGPSLKALEKALGLAEEFGAKVTLLHVIETVSVPEFATYPNLPTNDQVAAAKVELAALAKDHGCDEATVGGVKVRTGVPFREITNAARALRADMIVIATHGYTGFKHVLLGSTAERVVRYADCPVLVVPTQTRA